MSLGHSSTPLVQADDWANAVFLISTPGIREKYPKLDLGDLAHLREVVEH
jgi:hypothetical protein